MSQTLLVPDHVGNTTANGRWMVEIFNNNHNSFDEVIDALIKGTGCDAQEAYMEAWEAHNFGKASVHFGSRKECQDAAVIISKVGVRTEVSKEWSD